jgi:RNA 2',3'-cyclic 3'-phosphodiesterase
VKEPSRRLFFALWPTARQQASMANATREALLAGGGRPVPEGNLHVTLAFLGSVSESRMGELSAIARRGSSSAGAVHPFDLSFERLEVWKKAQVLCALPALESEPRDHAGVHPGGRPRDAAGVPHVRVSPDTPDVHGTGHAAARLAAALKTGLVAGSFTPDLKPFRAHVTLARKVSPGSDWQHELRMHSVSWRFTGFSLMESRTDASGALYSVLESWLLARPHID